MDLEEAVFYSVGTVAALPLSMAAVYVGVNTYATITATRDFLFRNDTGRTFSQLYRLRYRLALRDHENSPNP